MEVGKGGLREEKEKEERGVRVHTHCQTPRGGNGKVSLAQMDGMVSVRQVWASMAGREKGGAGMQWRGEEMVWWRWVGAGWRLGFGEKGGGAGWAVVVLGWRIGRRRRK